MKTDRIFYHQQEIDDIGFRENILELIKTILIDKFVTLSREEIEAMFAFSDLKQTRVYQEAKEEGKLESIPGLLAIGLTVEQIVTALGLEVVQVQTVAEKQSTEGDITPD